MTCVLSTALPRGRAEAVQFAVRLEQVVVQQKLRQEEAASDAQVTAAAAVAKCARAALHFNAKPQIVLDCFKPDTATPANMVAFWSRRRSAETKCVYEGAGCLLSQVLADEPADEERSVAELSTDTRIRVQVETVNS
jgi:hypothetical protein